jgi:hypothetical protein
MVVPTTFPAAATQKTRSLELRHFRLSQIPMALAAAASDNIKRRSARTIILKNFATLGTKSISKKTTRPLTKKISTLRPNFFFPVRPAYCFSKQSRQRVSIPANSRLHPGHIAIVPCSLSCSFLRLQDYKGTLWLPSPKWAVRLFHVQLPPIFGSR